MQDIHSDSLWLRHFWLYIISCISHSIPNQLPSSFRRPHSVHSPPGSPHLARIASSQSPPSFSHLRLPRPFTPALKLISFTNPFPHSLFRFVLTTFTDLGLGPYLVGTAGCFFLFQFLLFIFLLLVSCASWPHPGLQSTLMFGSHRKHV